MVTFCVPVTIGVAWIVVRVLAPFVPAQLPELGSFRLRDYRGSRRTTSALWRTPVSAFVGALSHVGLDHLTHPWGWFARNVDWYDDVIADISWFGRPLTVFEPPNTSATSGTQPSASRFFGVSEVSVG